MLNCREFGSIRLLNQTLLAKRRNPARMYLVSTATIGRYFREPTEYL